jgi:hypothetical protein
MNGVPTKHKMGLVAFEDSTFVVDAKDVVFTEFMFDPNKGYIPRVDIMEYCWVYGTWLKGVQERNTMVIVQTHDRVWHACPLFTDTSVLFSNVIREDWSIVKRHTFGTLVHQNSAWDTLSLGNTRYVRFARTGDGFTGVFELVSHGWQPCSYMYTRAGEILQMEIQAMGADLVDESAELCMKEYNCSRQAYQRILESCVYLTQGAYKS